MAARSADLVNQSDRMVLTLKMPPCEAAAKILQFYGAIDAAMILEEVRQRLDKEEFYPDSPTLQAGWQSWGLHRGAMRR